MKITKEYSKSQYVADVEHFSLDDIWDAILDYVMHYGETDFLKVDLFGDLYELGLSIKDKESKKKNGVYYTPKDVSDLMAEYYVEQMVKGANLCDVCAGTGNLIISVLEQFTSRQRKRFLEGGRVFLYDMDPLALKIAAHRIGYLFGYHYMKNLNIIVGDFLDQTVLLPKKSVVISNPPYFKISEIGETWEKTPLLLKSKEYYGIFMEKCIKQAVSCVFITPYSFVGGSKFFELRRLLNKTDSRIFVFDNVPGNIFKGKKHGIFNSNTSNATRAAISIVNTKKALGAVVSPMIRFQTSERSRILSRDVLDGLLNMDYHQVVSDEEPMYRKCFPEDIQPFEDWCRHSDRFESLLSSEPTKYKLDMVTTCRYFTVASKRDLMRDGKYVLYFRDQDSLNYAYALLNASFAYWYWRVYDGAITYPLSLLYNMPINYKELDEHVKEELGIVCDRIGSTEQDHLIYKKNANKMQENVKFTVEQRGELNELMSRVLGVGYVNFDRIHSPVFFGEKFDCNGLDD